ncbi:MAG TPA: phosphate ABC transporter substrate-binding protein PstS [Gemmatimonadaceae bacterium]|nr:phosphate ABC transporter substrate-binding protein PstS [Gemmatimonadaceae bacterium]
MRALPVVIATSVLLLACGGGSEKSSAGTGGTAAVAASQSGTGADLTGAGGTFPAPIYAKWFTEYAQKSGVKINYQPIGSGGGIRQLSDMTVDFGASDAPMTDDQLSKAKGGPILHIPTVLGAVAVTYNIPGVTQSIRLTGPLVADIFSGKIKQWNDSRITALNGSPKLPATDILVVHRSDASGTTFIFSDYLSSVSPDWKSAPGKGTQLSWPVGLGGKGNEGVSGQVKQTPGAIGYVELAYAKQNNLPVAALQNAAGEWVTPSIEGATAAAAGAAAKLPPNTDYRISIVNAPGKGAYPISSFTWLLVYKHMPDAAKAKKLADYIHWMLDDGEKEAGSLDYAPLPQSMIPRLDSLARTVTGGAPSA